MSKHAYIFPGQGSQFRGMGKDLYENCPQARKMMEEANEILGYRLTDIMFEGSNEELTDTSITQPAVFLHSVALAASLEDFRPDMVAGHSLGEFSAVVASGALSLEDGLNLVNLRARAMQKACASNPGAMAAIINLPSATIESICSQVPGIVVAANYNSPVQTVISGEVAAVDLACEKLKEAGARRALKLQVGGAFHSPLMQSASDALAKAIFACNFKTPVCPIYQNVSAEATLDPEVIKANLLSQLTSPVRWCQTLVRMAEDGCTEFTEVGPGAVLQGLVQKTLLGEHPDILVNAACVKTAE